MDSLDNYTKCERSKKMIFSQLLYINSPLLIPNNTIIYTI